MGAARWGHPGVVQLLLDGGANKGDKDKVRILEAMRDMWGKGYIL